VLAGLLALVGYLLRIASGKHSELSSRLASVTATKPQDNAVSRSSGGIVPSPPLASPPQSALERFQSPSNSPESPPHAPQRAGESSQEDSNGSASEGEGDGDNANDDSLSDNSSVSSGSPSEGSPSE
jgi:hypothetical protein